MLDGCKKCGSCLTCDQVLKAVCKVWQDHIQEVNNMPTRTEVCIECGEQCPLSDKQFCGKYQEAEED